FDFGAFFLCSVLSEARNVIQVVELTRKFIPFSLFPAPASIIWQAHAGRKMLAYGARPECAGFFEVSKRSRKERANMRAGSAALERLGIALGIPPPTAIFALMFQRSGQSKCCVLQ